MDAPIRVGVAGTGHWANTAHLPAIEAHPDAVLAAIADPYPPNLDRARHRFSPGAAYDDPLAMLEAEELDAVVVATPHVHHHPIAAAAIAGGRHVLVEKPFVLEPAHGRALMAAAEVAAVEIIVGYPWHYNDQTEIARRWIAAGEIGEISYVESFFGSNPLNLYRARPEESVEDYGEGNEFFAPRPTTYSDKSLSGGGQGQTQVTHSLALLLHLTGLRPQRVSAFMASMGTDVDVNDAFSMRFEGGAVGTIGSHGATTPSTHTELVRNQIHGSEGHLEFDVMAGRLEYWNQTGSASAPAVDAAMRYPMMRPATNLIDVALGRAPNRSSAVIGQLTVETLHAAYRSAAADGMPIDVGSD